MDEYIKGECLSTDATGEKLIKWVAQEKPYFFFDKIHKLGHPKYYKAGGCMNDYFQAIPKPEAKKLYVYRDLVDNNVEIFPQKFTDDAWEYYGEITLDIK